MPRENMNDGEQGFDFFHAEPGKDCFMVLLVGIGLAACCAIALWALLVPGR